MNGTDLIDRIAGELFDPSHQRWSRGLLADYVTWAQDWVVSMRPDAYAVHETVTLASGAEQSLASLASDGWRVIRGSRNSNGQTIRTLTKDELDRLLPPDWPQISGTPYYLAVDRIAHDRFWVWPTSATSIEIVVAKRPTEVTTANEGNALDLGDYLREPIADMALSFALRRNTSEASVNYSATLAQRAEQTLARVLPMPGQSAAADGQGVQQ